MSDITLALNAPPPAKQAPCQCQAEEEQACRNVNGRQPVFSAQCQTTPPHPLAPAASTASTSSHSHLPAPNHQVRTGAPRARPPVYCALVQWGLNTPANPQVTTITTALQHPPPLHAADHQPISLTFPLPPASHPAVPRHPISHRHSNPSHPPPTPPKLAPGWKRHRQSMNHTPYLRPAPPDAVALPATVKKSLSKSDPPRPRPLRETLLLTMLVSVSTAFLVALTSPSRDLDALVRDALPPVSARPAVLVAPAPAHKRLLFYNKPPKTGSTTVRIAMKKATEAAGLVGARCFKMIDWNEMALRTLVHRGDVDFYGCHTRMDSRRFDYVSHLRGGNVTFITNTRDPQNIIFSSYLQKHRDRNIADITDPQAIQKEIAMYKEHIDLYPVDALYKYHGAEVPLTSCPVSHAHVMAMRRIAERYEVVIDLQRPHESADMVEVVTGLKPDFNVFFNERTTNITGPMLTALSKVDTSHRECGNELVHKVLLQQFNVIKDRLMQNMCFDEATGTFDLCDKVSFKKSAMVQSTREEAQRARKELMQM